MYSKVTPPIVLGGSGATVLAKTGFSSLAYALVALALIVGGLVLLRVAMMRRAGVAGQA